MFNESTITCLGSSVRGLLRAQGPDTRYTLLVDGRVELVTSEREHVVQTALGWFNRVVSIHTSDPVIDGTCEACGIVSKYAIGRPNVHACLCGPCYKESLEITSC